MEKKNHTFLYAMKLWLIWNVVADLSIVIIIGGPIALEMLYTDAVDIFSPSLMPFLISRLLLPLGSVLIVGLIQWIAFIHKIKHSYWWIVATALGWSVAGISLMICLYLFPTDYWGPNPIELWILAGTMVGALIGLPQWLVLRGKVSGAGWWLLWTVLGWACAGCAAYVYWQAGTGSFGAVVGLSFMSMITGVAYAYLFSQPGQSAPYPR